MLISIITPAYNRADEIPHLLESIAKQTVASDRFEMVIVDDGSTDQTVDIIEAMIPSLNFNLNFVKQENAGPGSARNQGIEEAKGELYVFIDSDCEADPRWLEIILDSFEREGFDAFGGPDASKGDFTTLQRAIDFSMTSFLTTGGLRGHSVRPLAKFYPRSHNMGMTRSLYEKVGGFGSLRHGQDIELSNRILKSGAKVTYLPEAIVYHRRRTTLKKFFRQVFNWGVARINLGKVDSKMLEPLHFFPAVITVIASIITVGFFIDPIKYDSFFELGFGFFLFLAGTGAWKLKDLKIFFTLLAVIPIQVFGYGLGFIVAFVFRFILRQKVWTGFRKKYY